MKPSGEAEQASPDGVSWQDRRAWEKAADPLAELAEKIERNEVRFPAHGG